MNNLIEITLGVCFGIVLYEVVIALLECIFEWNNPDYEKDMDKSWEKFINKRRKKLKSKEKK